MTALARPATDDRVRAVIERTDSGEWCVILPDGKTVACASRVEAQRSARNYLKRSLASDALSVIEWRL